MFRNQNMYGGLPYSRAKGIVLLRLQGLEGFVYRIFKNSDPNSQQT
jgi:hypothetical protein